MNCSSEEKQKLLALEESVAKGLGLRTFPFKALKAGVYVFELSKIPRLPSNSALRKWQSFKIWGLADTQTFYVVLQILL